MTFNKFFLAMFLALMSLPAISQSWQQSTSVEVNLGIRDKYGDKKGYAARFIVTDPSGKHHSLEVRVKDNDWGGVYFPSDFAAGWLPGQYYWKGVVDGKTVIKGGFKYQRGTDGEKILPSHWKAGPAICVAQKLAEGI